MGFEGVDGREARRPHPEEPAPADANTLDRPVVWGVVRCGRKAQPETTCERMPVATTGSTTTPSALLGSQEWSVDPHDATGGERASSQTVTG